MDEILADDGDANSAAASDDEEALSLSDLPLIHQSRKQIAAGSEEIVGAGQTQLEDFDFCSKESEMCAADEVFYRGQILPFRHSGKRPNLSRSESMDCNSSGGIVTSRSSSIRSSSSGSSSATHTKPHLNPFHSLPSPSPKLPGGAAAGRTNRRSCAKKTSAWNIFRRGLLTTPPKIAFQDLKTRRNLKSNFGSRNSNSSNSSSLSSNSTEKKTTATKGSPNFLGGCNCAVDTVSSNVAFMKRSMSEGHRESRVFQLEEEANLLLQAAKSTKKRVSHHRTFEWLKQLSVEGTPDEL
ncbi:uncharacterized protein LOC127240501 [Andrographis paniculata]|uniref:uncharacterized protein LOC127240501 n=1 Tax=Andrographis paniculata TaxID=175694 RepID=UPI0021E754F1|nr:uncharacterized protein LOC127240501 [Andrographis paniculata]